MILQIKLIIKKELKIFFHTLDNVLSNLLFYLVSLAIFPLIISTDYHMLRLIGPDMMLAFLLLVSSLLSTYLFTEDEENGYLEQMILTPVPGYGIMLAKIISHLLCIITPLLFSLILMGILYDIKLQEIFLIMFIFFIASPIFSAISCLSAAISINCRKKEFISSCIALPLQISAAIFTSNATHEIMTSHHHLLDVLKWEQIELLLALILILLPLSCYFGGLIIVNSVK